MKHGASLSTCRWKLLLSGVIAHHSYFCKNQRHTWLFRDDLQILWHLNKQARWVNKTWREKTHPLWIKDKWDCYAPRRPRCIDGRERYLLAKKTAATYWSWFVGNSTSWISWQNPKDTRVWECCTVRTRHTEKSMPSCCMGWSLQNKHAPFEP